LGQEAEKRREDLEIYIPPGPRLGDLVFEFDKVTKSYDDRLILKLFRRIQPGVNPDFEIGRQLTEKAGFTRVPAVAAAVEYAGIAEIAATLGMMQQFVESQADGWRHATDEVARFYEAIEGRTPPPDPLPPSFPGLIAEAPREIEDLMRGYLATADTLGRRTAEMHLALASDSAAAWYEAPLLRSRSSMGRSVRLAVTTAASSARRRATSVRMMALTTPTAATAMKVHAARSR